MSWTTDERADTSVRINRDGRWSDVGYEGFFALDHQMGVSADDSEQLRVVSCDLHGNCAEAVVG